MHSFFTEAPVDGLVRLAPEDAQHALKALRLRAGEKLAVVFEGSRHEAAFEVLDGQACARVLRPLPGNEPRLRVTLYQGLPKGDRMEGIVQKCTELGVHRIVPCLFSRCVARWEGNGKKQARWQRIAREAAVQCGRAHVPLVGDCLPFQALPEALGRHQLALVPWEQGSRPMRAAWQGELDLALVIGPEGGITPAEIDALKAQAITLGPRILRTETAGMAALAMAMMLAGEMEMQP